MTEFIFGLKGLRHHKTICLIFAVPDLQMEMEALHCFISSSSFPVLSLQRKIPRSEIPNSTWNHDCMTRTKNPGGSGGLMDSWHHIRTTKRNTFPCSEEGVNCECWNSRTMRSRTCTE